MAWNNTIVTNAGTTMLNNSMAGRVLSFKSVSGGTGTVDTDQLAASTRLVQKKQDLTLLEIETVKKQTDGGEQEGIKIKIQLSNKDLQESYQLQQVGVFARLNGDGTDTLLFIMQDEAGIFIPSASENPEFVLELYVFLTISNKAGINISIDSSALVSEHRMQEALAKKQDITPAVPFSILTTGWETDESVPQYPNCYDVTVEELKETDIVSVVVAPESAAVVQTANFAPVTQSYAGKFRLRAAAVPSGTITAQYQIVSTVAKEVS